MQSGLIARLRERGVQRAPLVVALLGFPIAIAWFLGNGAVRRDAAADGVVPPVTSWRRHVDIGVIGVLGAIVGFFLIRDFRRDGLAWPSESAVL